MDWFKDNNKKVGDIITTRVHEVMKTGVKVSMDNDKKLIVSIKKGDLAKSSADADLKFFQSRERSWMQKSLSSILKKEKLN